MIYLRKIILKNNFGWLFSFHEIVINFEMFQNDPKAVTSTHKIHLSILWRPNILLRQTMDTVNILNMGL
jgi:hypothetical protein